MLVLEGPKQLKILNGVIQMTNKKTKNNPNLIAVSGKIGSG